MRVKTMLLACCLTAPLPAAAARIPLVDTTGAPHGTVSVNLPRGLVRLKVAGLAPLPADVSTGAETFTSHVYKAYLTSSADPAVEIFLTDVYPDARARATHKVALAGDVSRMGCDRITVTAFSKDGQKSFDVLTATLAP